ncbi:hypothetical protein CJ030_MR1G016583 [Morella rubra]|uniref:Uncharacterized protein n=1 Tax=Morella rubra TaxID=262757 RepID=A0A6A1WK90_9ROSI|nr:hypothetical protein CJ030_MR3G017031 [Morella rubra]KAB1225203.1 hypothetical protein CJ030_MR1G016583 [Morella rubra]
MRLGSKYLDFPLVMPHSKLQAFQHMRDKVIQKLACWKAKVLLQAGCTTLLRVTASAMPQYQMTSLLLPKTWCVDMDWRFKSFWWGFGDSSSRHFSPVAWSRICFPKQWGFIREECIMDLARPSSESVFLAVGVVLWWAVDCSHSGPLGARGGEL